MIVADHQLFVSTRDGKILCFGEADVAHPKHVKTWETHSAALSITPEAARYARSLIREAAGRYGTAIVIGLADGNLVKALAMESEYHILAFDDDANRIERLRLELQLAGVYGERVAVIQGDLKHVSLPPYLASVIVTESADRVPQSGSEVLQSLRPFGGIAALGDGVASVQMLKSLVPGNFELSTVDGMPLIRRAGALPGTADYQGNYEHCEDALVRFPLGVLWFDDSLAHFKRSPQPQFQNGIMISRPKDWHAERIQGNNSVDYPLPTALSLVAMPETHEQWASWGDCPIEVGSIQRIGLNFGAPGDRMTRDGTLWLDYRL